MLISSFTDVNTLTVTGSSHPIPDKPIMLSIESKRISPDDYYNIFICLTKEQALILSKEIKIIVDSL